MMAGVVFAWYIKLIYRLKKGRIKLLTYDEGSSLSYSHEFIVSTTNFRDRLFDRKFIGYPTRVLVKASQRHYAITPFVPSIYDSDKCVLINLLGEVEDQNVEEKMQDVLKLFVGQPFEIHLSSEQLNTLSNYLKNSDFVYLPHPKELKSISNNVPGLHVEHPILIMEELVSNKLKQYRRIEIYGGYSTVFFTINHKNVRKVYLSMDCDPVKEDIMKRCGCEITRL
jgi:hypothetical protein